MVPAATDSMTARASARCGDGLRHGDVLSVVGAMTAFLCGNGFNVGAVTFVLFYFVVLINFSSFSES